MTPGMIVTLAEGLWRDGVRHEDAEVRALTGADEVLISDLSQMATPVERATALIAATTYRVGKINAPTLEDVRALIIGDRERLLLALYRLSFGGQIEAVARCPDAGCAAALEMDLAVEELLQPTPTGSLPSNSGPLREIEIANDSGRWQVQCRLPNGGDQEEVARLARSDFQAAADLILRRCIVQISDADGAMVEPEDTLPVLRLPLAEAFLRLDPQAETRLSFACPDCGAETTALFDAAHFLMAELARTDGIFVEVDRLARSYHWSEAEILALPMGRRRRYLDLLAAE